ncbi:NADH-quinone oxidoreductase subunit L [Fontisphaera persica]|uniref:NADH-quinone oxidoreductase subunit L n=1 Tax=Fontisphaera persica TaxID=2974023 RepID=UPI0024C0D7A4|nr:NADH-quinone oxidoreductase subunit L [Fontisphaera persica]WCJ59298.1 NADH-quinone oxidoreductase subunit L [Fontisphaera persica]
MSWIAQHLYWIPLLPLLAAGVTALLRRERRGLAAGLAIGAMGGAVALALWAFVTTLQGGVDGEYRHYVNFTWLVVGEEPLRLGWVLHPLSAGMALMVSLVGLLIFIFSVGYMGEDPNFTRFFCFLSLFAAAMLGVVIANSLLLLFVCWELVGLTSYLLIGFWFHKPAAAAAAKKAFITTRIGDLGFFLGLLWLYRETGTLLFYDEGAGCLEHAALARLTAVTVGGGLTLSTAIAALIFCGAVGKSGQLPLHVWLPDAMEGPTPVSALIHAATMVAAGVFLVARMYPVFAALPEGVGGVAPALKAVAWTGAATALFAALVAVAQTDIKRILAYSTVSQLGFMMLGLGTGGVAVGMFHLITHAFFKALLFLGAGSVIHGCHHEQDIRHLGGLKGRMPWTFATYTVGMLALAGFPVLFSGFWSKDEILHAAHGWPVSHVPFYLALAAAALTAFYMMRQTALVFGGRYRGGLPTAGKAPHESPAVMVVPLVVLAVGAVGLGFLGTPAWPWLRDYWEGRAPLVRWSPLWETGTLVVMALSSAAALGGLTGGWWIYGRRPRQTPEEPDPLERWQPAAYHLLRAKFYFDELYEATVIRWNGWAAAVGDWLDRWVWGGVVWVLGVLAQACAWVARLADEYVVNGGFDAGCHSLRRAGGGLARMQSGRVQLWLRALGVGLVALVLYLAWS